MSIDYLYVSNKILHLEQGVSLYNAKPSLHFWQQEAFIPAYHKLVMKPSKDEGTKTLTFSCPGTTTMTGLPSLGMLAKFFKTVQQLWLLVSSSCWSWTCDQVP